MLVKSSEIITRLKTVPETTDNKKPEPISVVTDEGEGVFVDDKSLSLSKAIGLLKPGKTTHFYSYGNFNLVRLILHLIKQTGPVNLFMTSYSISATSIEQLQRRIEQKLILSFRLIMDNRVRSLSPKPFQMLSTVFNCRCSSIHAKVALLWNDTWHISIVTSQNATDNPKLERGTIFTDPDIFKFDLNALENEFNRGTT